MQYRFYLDGNLIVENPSGWDKMAIEVNRDATLKAMLVNLNATLTFRSDGYDYIKNIYDGSGYCAEIKISIHQSIDNGQNFIERHRGLLFLSDMVFDDFAASVQVKFTDDSFYGRIANRRGTEAYLTGDKTVNGEALTPCYIRAMDLFDPATGTYVPLTQTHGCYKVYDALKYMLSFMTDNLVDFDSPLFGTGGDFSALMLTFGYPIRAQGNGNNLSLSEFTSNMPPITFESLFDNLNKRLNLGFFVDNTGSKPKVIIDYWNKLFLENETATFENLPNLKTQIAKDQIYSDVKFGGQQTLDIPAASFPETIRFIGFNSEQYAITGKCNVANVLDLSYSFVSSSNVIEQTLILSGIDKSYDKEWFLIDSYEGFQGKLVANKSNWLTNTPPPYFYNERFNNYEISKRFLGFVPNSIAAYLGNGNDGFLATRTTDQAPVFGAYTVIIFNNDVNTPNNDPNGNYNPVTGRYTVPTSGVYGFETKINEYNIGFHNIYYEVNIYMEHYDSLAVLIERRLVGVMLGIFGYLSDTFSSTFLCNSLDYIVVSFKEAYAFDRVRIKPDSTFACIISVNGGGIYQTYDPADYPIIINEFKTEIRDSQTNSILADTLSKIKFYLKISDQKTAWIDSLSINEFEGTVQAKLLNSRGKAFPPSGKKYRCIATHYFQIDRIFNWAFNLSYDCSLDSVLINGIEKLGAPVLFTLTEANVTYALGIDGFTLYPTNFIDQINPYLPVGLNIFDDFRIIDSVNGDSYQFKFTFEDAFFAVTYHYIYDSQLGFSFDDGASYSPYACANE